MHFNKIINIGNRIISEETPVYIIAEAGVNHNGSFEAAKELIDIAAEAGADSVKFQSFKTEELIIKNVKKAPYQAKTTDGSESQYDMLKKLEMDYEKIGLLMEYAEKKNINLLSTPFNESSIYELQELKIQAYKVASTDITNLPFLRKIALLNKPIILSTGMSYLSEVELALREIFPFNKDVILLQCTANYPIKDEEANLKVLNTYKTNFDILIGYSDHTVGYGASPFSVAMGAKVVEKHFTLDKLAPGPDHSASLSPQELINYIRIIRQAEKFMGNGIKSPTLSETKTRNSLQKYLVAKTHIQEGESFTIDNITAKRTGGEGISPIYFWEIVGKKASRGYVPDEIISE